MKNKRKKVKPVIKLDVETQREKIRKMVYDSSLWEEYDESEIDSVIDDLDDDAILDPISEDWLMSEIKDKLAEQRESNDLGYYESKWQRDHGHLVDEEDDSIEEDG